MILVCGEALVDLAAVPTEPAGQPVTYQALPGGSPANTAVGLARLGTPTGLLARLSGDGFGRLLRAHLSEAGVDLRYVVPAEQPSSVAVIDVGPDGSADYVFYLQGTADWQWSAAELPPTWRAEATGAYTAAAGALRPGQPGRQTGEETAATPPAVTALHAGSLALALQPGADVLAGLLRREQGRLAISLDPNVRPGLFGDPASYWRRLADLLRIADVVKVSVEDLAWIHPGQPAVQVARSWRRLGPGLVVVTAGADGAFAVTGDAAGHGELVVHRAAQPVGVVDTIGAGDAFAAGLLDWLHRHHLLRPGGLAEMTLGEVVGALDFAGTVAALTCARPGADPPARAELPTRS